MLKYAARSCSLRAMIFCWVPLHMQRRPKIGNLPREERLEECDKSLHTKRAVRLAPMFYLALKTKYHQLFRSHESPLCRKSALCPLPTIWGPSPRDLSSSPHYIFFSGVSVEAAWETAGVFLTQPSVRSFHGSS